MLRIAVVQFEPKIGKVQENVDVATQLCAQLERGDVDIVCLPEMSFTGMKPYVTTLVYDMCIYVLQAIHSLPPPPYVHI